MLILIPFVCLLAFIGFVAAAIKIAEIITYWQFMGAMKAHQRLCDALHEHTKGKRRKLKGGQKFPQVPPEPSVMGRDPWADRDYYRQLRIEYDRRRKALS